MIDKMFYVPILKWKRAEKEALQSLSINSKGSITPLIELVMPRLRYKNSIIQSMNREELFNATIREYSLKTIHDIPKELNEYWGSRPAYIDFSLLYTTDLKVNSIRSIIPESFKLGTHPIPVLNLSDDSIIAEETQRILLHNKGNICIRIVSSDFDSIDILNKKIQYLLKSLKAVPEIIDILIDLKNIYGKAEEYHKYASLSQRIIGLDSWRSFIFSAGSFPENLSNISIEEPGLVPRVEWQNWLALSTLPIKRIPIFSDYTVRNPIYNESVQYYQPTASIRYTLEDKWLILKGKKGDFGSYLANAALLAKDPRYYGEIFSEGDKYIADKARYYDEYILNPAIKGTGNTSTWLRAFISHHIALTAHQIANLS